MTQEERMTKQGYQLYKGKWLTAEEIEILEDMRKQKDAEREWFQKIARWRSWLDTERNRQGHQNIAAIEDPRAIKALEFKLVEKGGDPLTDARLVYVEALGHIHTPEAASVLAICRSWTATGKSARPPWNSSKA